MKTTWVTSVLTPPSSSLILLLLLLLLLLRLVKQQHVLGRIALMLPMTPSGGEVAGVRWGAAACLWGSYVEGERGRETHPTTVIVTDMNKHKATRRTGAGVSLHCGDDSLCKVKRQDPPFNKKNKNKKLKIIKHQSKFYNVKINFFIRILQQKVQITH